MKGKGHRRQDKATKPGGTTAGLVFPAPICLLFPILLIHTWPLSLHDSKGRKVTLVTLVLVLAAFTEGPNVTLRAGELAQARL